VVFAGDLQQHRAQGPLDLRADAEAVLTRPRPPPCILCMENRERDTQGGVRVTLTTRASLHPAAVDQLAVEKPAQHLGFDRTVLPDIEAPNGFESLV
jgi:hypothetical protein